MDLPKVSIITIYHNRENGVTESIQSLLDQTYKNIDIIIIDDCSTDFTLKKLQEIQNKDTRVKLIINTTNKGFTASLADAIDTLDSKYIAIHGSGDISLPSRIEEQVSFLERTPDAGVVTVGVVNRQTNNFSTNIKEITTRHLLIKNRVNHGASMYRLDKYKEAGGYRKYFIYRQDKDLWYRMSLITKIYFYPEKLYKWVRQESSVSETSGKNLVPALISEFATFLIKERLVQGYDSLDKYGEKAALFFNPSNCNGLLFRDYKHYFLRRKYDLALAQLEVLLKINTGFVTKFAYRLLILFTKIVMKIFK